MLYEQLKSKKRIVPKVNLKVTLKNVEYSKLKSLSWGEKDRISFALIMALSTINPSPVIMFDETFASLNKERIEICLTALKFAARSGKVVIITGHEQNGSYCDKIIKLE
jgi:ABC-type hemin transport system ATPase subunit